MLSLDQVLLLEQKVESAVAKIEQLQAENDALRKRCDELTNALSSKTEQLSSIETDQNQIETGIKKALDRLLYIENAVLKNGSTEAVNTINPVNTAVTENVEKVQVPTSTPTPQNTTNNSNTSTQAQSSEQKPVSYVTFNQPIAESGEEEFTQINVNAEETSTQAEAVPGFDSMQPLTEQYGEEEEEENQDNLGFDIF